MQKQWVIFALAMLAFARFSWSDQKTPAAGAGATQPSQHMDGVSDAEAAAIKSLLGKVTTAALSRNKFNGLTQFLQLENNSKSGPFQNYDDINTAVGLVQRDWKNKFGGEFDLTSDDGQMVFNDLFQISHSNDARMASERVTPGQSPVERANVVLTIQQSEDMASVSVDLIPSTQPTDWKIGITPGTNETAIHDSLLKQLNILHDQRSNLPADKAAAYRIVIDRVLTALAEAGQHSAAN